MSRVNIISIYYIKHTYNEEYIFLEKLFIFIYI